MRYLAVFIGLILFGSGGCTGANDAEATGGPGKANGSGQGRESIVELSEHIRSLDTVDAVRQESNRVLVERVAVDTLYLTDDGRRFIAPGNRRRVTVDPETGKLAWGAWQCDNPDCPGRASDGSPQLFAWPRDRLYAREDGTVGVGPSNRRTTPEPMCPACLELRDLASESDADREQYFKWRRIHVLPGAANRLDDLAMQYKQLVRREQEIRRQAVKVRLE